MLQWVLWAIAVAAHLVSSQEACVENPPYIYVTTHDEVPNVLKYTLDGCLVSKDVLEWSPNGDDSHFTEFRSMAIGRYKNQKQALYIADAMSRESYLLVYSECDANGRRQYLDTVVSTGTNPGADHTYGICLDDEGNVYASFQHTDCVLRFERDTFRPIPLPSTLRMNYRWRSYFPGMFVQFGEPGLHPPSQQGVRGIIVVGDCLWVANEDMDGVAVVSLATGMINNIVVVHNPIGLHYDSVSGLVFVSSKDRHWKGAVHGVDPTLLRIVRTYTTLRMNHPTGITSHGDILYVGEQIRGDIMKFSISEQRYLGNLITDGPGEIEQLLLSPC